MQESADAPDMPQVCRLEISGRAPVQFPLIVFFELTGLVSVACVFAGITGWMSAICLSAMACAMLYRLGVGSLASFGLALLSIPPESAFEGATVCVAQGALIARWPFVHASVMKAVYPKKNGRPVYEKSHPLEKI